MSKVTEILDDILIELRAALAREYRVQGHVLTGETIRNLRVESRSVGEIARGRVYGPGHTEYLERGVRAKNIPFSPGSGKPRSKYISGLIDYWRKRGLPPGEAKSAAFATAHKHKNEGMPTAASRRFSRNGKRRFAAKRTVEQEGPELLQRFRDAAVEDTQARIDSVIKGFQ